MAGEWEGKFKSFLKKTSEDVKRFGNDVKGEAEKLVKDPNAKKEWKDQLLGAAKATAEGVGKALEKPLKFAEKGVKKTVGVTPGMNPELWADSEHARKMSGDAVPQKYAHLEEQDPAAAVAQAAAQAAPAAKGAKGLSLKPGTAQEQHAKTTVNQAFTPTKKPAAVPKTTVQAAFDPSATDEEGAPQDTNPPDATPPDADPPEFAAAAPEPEPPPRAVKRAAPALARPAAAAAKKVSGKPPPKDTMEDE